jgi:hypothetical protein
MNIAKFSQPQRAKIEQSSVCTVLHSIAVMNGEYIHTRYTHSISQFALKSTMRLLQKYEGESNTTTCTNSSSNNKRRRKEEIKNVVSSSSRATTHNKVSALLILFMISILAFHIPMTSGLESKNNNNNNNNGSKSKNNKKKKKKNKGAHNRKQKQKQKVQRKAIVNGWSVNDVEKERFQFTTSIQYGSTHLCGGSLIAPDVVLSAAHCFHHMDGISIGDDDNDDDNNGDIRFLRVTVGEVSLFKVYYHGMPNSSIRCLLCSFIHPSIHILPIYDTHCTLLLHTMAYDDNSSTCKMKRMGANHFPQTRYTCIRNTERLTLALALALTLTHFSNRMLRFSK